MASESNVAVPVLSVATTSPSSLGVHAVSIILHGIEPLLIWQFSFAWLPQSGALVGATGYVTFTTAAVTYTCVDADWCKLLDIHSPNQ
eukprot:scaffold93420_cov59-Phaeocystis_antarctica.AAC.4